MCLYTSWKALHAVCLISFVKLLWPKQIFLTVKQLPLKQAPASSCSTTFITNKWTLFLLIVLPVFFEDKSFPPGAETFNLTLKEQKLIRANNLQFFTRQDWNESGVFNIFGTSLGCLIKIFFFCFVLTGLLFVAFSRLTDHNQVLGWVFSFLCGAGKVAVSDLEAPKRVACFEWVEALFLCYGITTSPWKES